MIYINHNGTHKITNFVYLHSIMQYGIILGSNSSYSKKSHPYKRTVRNMVHTKHTNTNRGLFMRYEILPLPCEYIFSLINSVKIPNNTSSKISCM
jgi:hypothetical protein